MKRHKYRNFITDFRPRRFTELVGQDHVVRIMKRWIQEESIPRAIVLSGDIGVGKSCIARLLVKSSICLSQRKGRFEQCGRCDECKTMNFTSYSWANGNRASTSQFSEEMKKAVSFGPAMSWMGEESPWYPIWIDECDEMTCTCQSNLLHIFDSDWSGRTYIVATTTRPAKIIPALYDRCYPIEILPPSKTELTKWALGICGKANITVDDNAAIGRIIDVCGRSFRGVLTTLQTIRDSSKTVNEKNVMKAIEISGKKS